MTSLDQNSGVTVAAEADVHTSHTAKIKAHVFVVDKTADRVFFLVFFFFHSTPEVTKTQGGRG